MYTTAFRIGDNMHWGSDVVFGALVGVTSGRTVTIQRRENRVSIAPWLVLGGDYLLKTACEMFILSGGVATVNAAFACDWLGVAAGWRRRL